jgi:UDP-glucuronate decarboxylase
MKILVAGGLGFIGSNLCQRLLDLDYQVICLDNGITGSENNIRTLLSNPNFFFIKHDVKDPLELKIDGIFNLACPASPPKYQKDPVDTFLTSILGSKNLLDLAMTNECAILQASTSEIYGDPEVLIQHEEYWGNVNSFGVRSCYDEGKRGAETLFHDYNKMYLVDTKVARIFNTYGPNMDISDGRVVSNFINQALENKPLEIYGDGQQIRSFCYVSDLIDGLLKLFFSSKLHDPVNLGNPQPVTMLELAKEIIHLTDSRSNFIFTQLPSNDPRIRIPSIEKAKKLLDWSPTIDRRAGLIRTIEYFHTATHF